MNRQFSELSSKYPFDPIYVHSKKSGIRIHSLTGLNTKLPIDKFFSLNFTGISLDYFKPDKLFLEEYTLNCISGGYSYKIYKGFSPYYYQELYHLIHNKRIKDKNYFIYLVNTPWNLILECTQETFLSYFYNSKKEYISTKKATNFDFELISLYHLLGVKLRDIMLEYKYASYLKANNIRHMINKKGKVILLTSTPFLSYRDYKNELVKAELSDLTTLDLVEYGRSMYLLFIYITTLYALTITKSLVNSPLIEDEDGYFCRSVGTNDSKSMMVRNIPKKVGYYR